jgi:uncharacterized protein
VREQLQLLEQLQEIDNQITRWEQDMARLPLEAQEVARNLVTLRREITEAQQRLDVVERDLKKQEQDLATEQEKIKRSERRLLGIKNQKEYNALAREVKLGKKVVAEIEETMMGFMAELEALKPSLERKTAEYEGFEKSLLEKKSEADSINSQAEKALVGLNVEKEKITQSIDRDFLKKYEMVRRARGNALAEVHNGSCTGCHMSIPAQLAITVLKQEEMVTCPNCLRMLYVKPENIPAHNKLDT